ncbi:probable palmitoyltransferase ZDHHC1 isoform X4 [Manacus vitellinus]|uniref:probable palmitoyltransferase ZDHHC1 isoform X4 n=1 Tax=Manacus vitellinus TaxID=328815 RepID=UPI00115CC7EB|nr:probable palmitoyltransferase ZDHHC1 isoform X4 [Manacus vitellinus]
MAGAGHCTCSRSLPGCCTSSLRWLALESWFLSCPATGCPLAISGLYRLRNVDLCQQGQILVSKVSIDPADANVREKNYLGPLATFNRNQHAHVIENHHCHVCDVDVLFLNSVLSAILGLGLLLLVAFYVFVEFFVDPTMLRSDHHFDALRNHMDRWLVFLPASPVETKAPAILVTAGIFILLSLVTVILLGHLLTFHIYLLWHKLTTYEYILQQRPQQEAEKGDKQQEPCSSQVRPSQEADLLSGNPGYTDPGIQAVEFSTVTSGKGFPKLYIHSKEGDPEQSSSPDPPALRFAVPSQQQKKRRKKMHRASSSAVDSGSKEHATRQPSFPDPQSDNPRGDRKKNLYSEHKVKRRGCQQDRRLEQDLELFPKVPDVFVSKSSGEPLVPQLQPRESTTEPDHRKCTSKQRVSRHDPCSKDIRTNTTAA